MKTSTDRVLFCNVLLVSLIVFAPRSNAFPHYASWSPSSFIRGRQLNSSVQPAANTVQQQGWTPGPEGRGTLDVIWSSFITIFLCSWTVLCLNVPPKRFGDVRLTWQKFLMTGLGAAGPEFILQTAIAQWVSARRSVEAFRSLGHDQWSMSHAFFADMGGFELHAEDWIPFPLDAKQVHFLLEKGYVSPSQVLIDSRVIEDKNKGDGMTRILTVGQIIWFSISSIARLIQHLAITTLELTTLGFIVCTLGSYYFWAQKPMDIRTAIPLVPNTTLVSILEAAGDQPPITYKRTPFDFVGRDEWRSWNLYWTYWMNILRKMRIVFHPHVRPIEKISDDYVPALSTWTLFFLFLFHTGYAAVHIAGWNFLFPSPTEKLLWHIATLTVMASICACWFIDVYTWQLHPALRKLLTGVPVQEPAAYGDPPSQFPSSHLRTKIEHAAQRLRNNSLTNDPDLTVPLKAMIPITVFGASYTIARVYILVEDVVNLRSQPSSVYESVNWSNFLPHW